MKINNVSGFTLIELIVVVVIFVTVGMIAINVTHRADIVPSYEDSSHTGFIYGEITNVGKGPGGYYAIINGNGLRVYKDSISPSQADEKYKVLLDAFRNKKKVNIEYYHYSSLWHIHTIEIE